MVWVAGAAMYDTASHFNHGPVMGAIYALMGALALILASASLAQGLAIARHPAPGLDPTLRQGLSLGLILTFVLTVVSAGIMAMHGSHFVGTPVTGASWPLVGWSAEVGDLRAAHLFATHAMHGLPLAAVVLIALRLPRQRLLIGLGAVAYTVLVLAILAEALAGRPFLWPLLG